MSRREVIRKMLPVLRARQVAMDESIAIIMEGRPPPTCASCTSPGCCYQKSVVQLAEALLIAEHLKKTDRDTVRLRAKLRMLGKEMEASSREAWFESMTPCVFLGEDKRCSIYEVRPVSCRTYYVVSEQANCQPPESLPIKQIDLRGMAWEELQQMTAVHLYWGLKETSEKMYMRSLPMAVLIALQFLEEPSREVLDKIPWPSAGSLGSAVVGLLEK